MIANGMNILRLNLRVLPKEVCRNVVKTVRELDRLSNYNPCTSIAMDLVVECVRTGSFEEVWRTLSSIKK